MADILVTTTVFENERKEVEAAVDDSIRAFEDWFQARGFEPLVKSEIAIVKTYLYFKIFEEKRDGA